MKDDSKSTLYATTLKWRSRRNHCSIDVQKEMDELLMFRLRDLAICFGVLRPDENREPRWYCSSWIGPVPQSAKSWFSLRLTSSKACWASESKEGGWVLVNSSTMWRMEWIVTRREESSTTSWEGEGVIKGISGPDVSDCRCESAIGPEDRSSRSEIQ
jgi:hypothetical protein